MMCAFWFSLLSFLSSRLTSRSDPMNLMMDKNKKTKKHDSLNTVGLPREKKTRNEWPSSRRDAAVVIANTVENNGTDGIATYVSSSQCDFYALSLRKQHSLLLHNNDINRRRRISRRGPTHTIFFRRRRHRGRRLFGVLFQYCCQHDFHSVCTRVGLTT